MDGISASELSQASYQQQAGMAALRSDAQNQQAIAAMIQQQALQVQQSVTPISHSSSLGSQVDTYA